MPAFRRPKCNVMLQWLHYERRTWGDFQYYPNKGFYEARKRRGTHSINSSQNLRSCNRKPCMSSIKGFWSGAQGLRRESCPLEQLSPTKTWAREMQSCEVHLFVLQLSFKRFQYFLFNIKIKSFILFLSSY